MIAETDSGGHADKETNTDTDTGADADKETETAARTGIDMDGVRDEGDEGSDTGSGGPVDSEAASDLGGAEDSEALNGATKDESVPVGCGGAIEFPDEGLAGAVRLAIDKPVGDILYTDLNGLSSLTAGSSGISDLTGIQCLYNITQSNLI